MALTRDPIEHFAYELLRQSGLDTLPEDAKAEFVVQLRDEAQRRIGALALQGLDAAGLREFQSLIGKQPPPDAAEVQAFFTARIPDFEEKLRKGLLTFAEEFFTAAKQKAA